jgi:radical SAM superfamily enzyme YgiQ (UPF0313 family)
MKVALLAISGVRAADPVLTEVGLTLPGFVERAQVIASLPSLGLLSIAAVTPEKHQVSYLEVPDVDALVELPECDLAAISTYTAQVADAYRLAARLRAAGVPTVMGGLHATVRPDEALQHCDTVVVGEGEPVWPRLLSDFENGRMEKVYRSDGDYDLADAPVPRFDLLEPERYNRLTVQTQRGCPWRCEFCANSILLTPRFKQKPVGKVMEEIRAIRSIWDQPFIEFADDNTFVNKTYGRELMEAIGPEGLRWFTETDVSVADDPVLLDLMREAGCYEVLIGFESPTEEGLEGIELKGNWKRRQADLYRRAIDLIQSRGIAVNACFVLGLDGDGPGVFDAIWRFVEDTQPFDVQITVMTPYPGTVLYDRLLAAGRLLDPVAWEKCTMFDINFEPRRMSVQQLHFGLIDLGLRLYSGDSTRQRRSAFKEEKRRVFG